MKNHAPNGSTKRARTLRSNPTDAERVVWRVLRTFPSAHFRRQVPIRHYIADFASHRAKLIIEVDGGQHNDDVDHERTRILEAEGYRIIRFWNHDVLANADGVWVTIESTLAEHHPHLASPIKGEGH